MVERGYGADTRCFVINMHSTFGVRKHKHLLRIHTAVAKKQRGATAECAGPVLVFSMPAKNRQQSHRGVPFVTQSNFQKVPSVFTPVVYVTLYRHTRRCQASEMELGRGSNSLRRHLIGRSLPPLAFCQQRRGRKPQQQVTKKSRMAALKAVGDFAKRLKGSPIIDRYARRCACSP